MLKNPTRFFKFENTTSTSDNDNDDDTEANPSDYAGPSLGAPIGLRDPLRPHGERDVFPQIVGKYPKPDMRTEREKKQAEREARMMAAAQLEQQQASNSGSSGGNDDEDLLAADRDLEEMGEPLDYNDESIQHWDSDDEEWPKGLDPVADQRVIQTPPDRRFVESDLDWVMMQLEGHVQHFEQQYKQDVETLQQRARTQLELESSSGETSSLNAAGSSNSLESIVLNLPNTELIALAELEGEFSEGKMTQEEFLAAATRAIPSLTEEQLRAVLGGRP